MTTIILDANAVRALFPEGSEARVQLQGTVLRKLAEQFIKEPQAISAVKSQVRELSESVFKEVLKKEGILPSAWGNSFTLSDAIKGEIERSARLAVTGALESGLRKAFDGLESEITVRVEARTQALVDEMARAALNKHLTALVANLPKGSTT